MTSRIHHWYKISTMADFIITGLAISLERPKDRKKSRRMGLMTQMRTSKTRKMRTRRPSMINS